MLVEDVIGWIGTAFSLTVFAAPATQFLSVLKGKLDYEDSPTVLIGTIYCNCLAWYSYGDIIFSDQMKTCNFIGFLISSIFIIIYLCYEIKKFLTDAILNALIVLTGTWAGYRALIYILADPSIVGKVCALTYLIALLYPLYLIYRVVREKNYTLISYVVSGASILSALFWGIYGIMERDNYIIVPNFLGVGVAVAQIVVSRVYKKKYPTIEQAPEASTVGIESTGDEEVSKRPETVEVKIDEEGEEKGKIKAKPVKIVTKSETKETPV